MEQMLPELEELEERGYLSSAEIKRILRRRAYFEYLMKRKAVVKADALRYSPQVAQICDTYSRCLCQFQIYDSAIAEPLIGGSLS